MADIDPKSIMALATQYRNLYTDALQMPVLLALLQTLVNNGSSSGSNTDYIMEGSGPPSSPPSDTSKSWIYFDNNTDMMYRWKTTVPQGWR